MVISITNIATSLHGNIFFEPAPSMAAAPELSDPVTSQSQSFKIYDIFSEIISSGDIESLKNWTKVDKTSKKALQLIIDNHQNQVINKVSNLAFGPEEWRKLGVEDSLHEDFKWAYLLLPPNIDEILQSSCPLFPESGKSVKDTHRLVYIPQNMSPTDFGKLVAKLLSPSASGKLPGYDWIADQILAKFNNPLNIPHWVLFPKDLLPESTNKTHAELEAMMKNYPNVYEFPDLMEVIICIYGELIKTGKNILGDHFTFCKENVSVSGKVIAGKIKNSGINVDFTVGKSASCGLVPVRKFTTLALRSS